MPTPERPARERQLAEACVAEALTIIGETGIETLSLREVARRLNVSHQAPYKHFPSRDHLVAELVRRAFHDFAAHLDARPARTDPAADLGGMGDAYLRYAREHPLHYRLMFGTPLPDPAEHPAMMQAARHAFTLLRDCLGRMHPTATPAAVDGDALFVWSCMHGAASITQTPALATLGLEPDVLDDAPRHIMRRVGVALESP